MVGEWFSVSGGQLALSSFASITHSLSLSLGNIVRKRERERREKELTFDSGTKF